mgnify:FL=1
MSARDKANRSLIHVILITGIYYHAGPFLWMILTAFKTMTEATSVNPFVILPSTWRWDSFKEVIENMDFLHLYINTLLLILGRVVCAVLTATLAGYAFGRLNFRGKNLMFSLVLFQMMVPGQIFIIPQYLMVSKMGMLNTIFAWYFPVLLLHLVHSSSNRLIWDFRKIWKRLHVLMDVTSARPSCSSWLL